MAKAFSAISADRRRQLRKAAVVLLVVAATAGGLALLSEELRRREKDWYAVLDQLVAIETRLRAGDTNASRPFEDGQPAGRPDGRHADARLLEDMKRLASVEDLRLRDVQVDVRGETAEATYRLGAGPSHEGETPPRAGRFVFRREGDRWNAETHTFIHAEGSTSSGGSGEEWRRAALAHRHRGSHQRLTTRLGAIAGLALSASLGCAFWPWLEARFASQPRRTTARGRTRGPRAR